MLLVVTVFTLGIISFVHIAAQAFCNALKLQMPLLSEGVWQALHGQAA